MSQKIGFYSNIFVMTFYINGIKQQKEKKYPVEMIVDVEQEATVRSFLEAHQILILSLKLYKEDKEKFGDIFLDVHYQNQIFPIISTYTDVQEACSFFLSMGMNVLRINSLNAPISEEQSKGIIAQIQQEVEHTTEVSEQERKLQEQEKKKMYSDAHLDAAKGVVLRVFEKIDQATTRAEGVIELQDMKELNRLSAELKKLRLGTNVEKIVDVIQSIFALIEKIDDAYFVAIQKQSEYVSPDSVVRLTDVDKELDRMENVKILKTIGAKISIKNQDYASFGPGAIFWKFLQKDMFNKLTNFPKILS